MKTTIIGTGSWGSALGQVLADNKQDVILYGIDPAEVEDINLNHRNSKYFEDVELNPDLKATNDLDVLKDSDVVVLAVPTPAIKSIAKTISPYLKDDVTIVNLAKGFDPKTFERMSVVLKENLPEEKVRGIVNLIGPSHAEEVVVRQLTTIDAVSDNQEAAQDVQNLFSNDYLRIYTGKDVIGSELGAAIKNVMAIASGILRGLGYKDNTQAALITRGLQEMIRFGLAYGADPQTFVGLTGIGDLVVTCTSENSRNFQAGFQIGQDNSIENFVKTNTKTVEGLNTARIVHELAKTKGLELPICEEVFQILYNNKEPGSSAKDLMLRELKAEFD